MASLKELRVRISSVQSTKRITSAMKMVAAAKLRRAQENAESARPYAVAMESMISALSQGVGESGNGPGLLVGNGKDRIHLLIVISSDRGLCGGFNGSIVRDVKARIEMLESQDKQVKLFIIGRKASVQLRRQYSDRFVEVYEDLCKPTPAFEHAEKIAERIHHLYDNGEFDVCSLVYNRFISVLTQTVTLLGLIPFTGVTLQDNDEQDDKQNNYEKIDASQNAVYEFEPDENEILKQILPKNISVQLFRALLESFASEQGARMTAMDNATRNAGDMIHKLQITYNRTRQAQITKELIEIISGAEAL